MRFRARPNKEIVEIMPDALIKGETHVSKRDKQALLGEDLTQFDAVFREGSNPELRGKDIGILYALYLIGYLVYGATYGRIYISNEDFKRSVERCGIPYDDDIDLSVCETYEMIDSWKRSVFAFLSAFIPAFFSGTILYPLRLIPGLTDSTGFAVVFVLGLMLFYGFSWALTYFQILDGRAMEARDEYMAEQILARTEETDWESILISCGDEHRPGIAASLEAEGWDVSQEPTTHWIGKLLNRIKAYRKKFKILSIDG